MQDEIMLTFQVPETDFDAISLELALVWLAKHLALKPTDDIGAIAAHQILKQIHDQYVDALGQPDWKLPAIY